MHRPAEILMVEDDPGDVELAREFLAIGRLCNQLHVVSDGVEAMAFLRREGNFASAPRPDLILLDMNLPRKSGREVLAELRSDEQLSRIPVAILTTSKAHEEVLEAQKLGADFYVSKPVSLTGLIEAVRCVRSLALSIVVAPSGE